MGTFHPPVCPPVPSQEYPLRSLYMRLYRSWIEGSECYPAEHAGREINVLLDAGHVESIRGGYRLTEAGAVAWAIMNEHVLCRPESIRLNSHSDNELRKVIEDMTQLTDDSKRVLEQLIEHEEGLPKDDFSTRLNALIRYGHIREESGTLFITDSGKRVLNGPPPKAIPPRARKGLKNPAHHTYNGALAHSDIAGSSDVRADMVIDDAMARKRSALPAGANGVPAPFAPPERTKLEKTVQALAKDTCTSECENCLKARVFDMVAQKLPEARDLLEAVRAQDAILKAIGK